MKVSAVLLEEIYQSLEHGDIQSIATQVGMLRTKVNRELTTMKSDYKSDVIMAAIARIEVRGGVLTHKNELAPF